MRWLVLVPTVVLLLANPVEAVLILGCLVCAALAVEFLLDGRKP